MLDSASPQRAVSSSPLKNEKHFGNQMTINSTSRENSNDDTNGEAVGFLIQSEGGDGLGLAVRLRNEGHPVSICIRDPSLESRGDGLVEKDRTPDYNPIVLADCTGSGPLLDTLRDSGAYTFGGSQTADRLESDRGYASSVFRQCGIKQPASRSFKDWNDAEDFISNQDDDTRLVFKPEGKFSGSVPSFVSHDNDELMDVLDHYKPIIGMDNPEFVLQEFIEGTAISSEAWFSGSEFIRPFNHTIERKQFMPGDIGPSGGCTGNVVWACDE